MSDFTKKRIELLNKIKTNTSETYKYTIISELTEFQNQIKDDRELLLESIKIYGNCIKFASPSLIEDEELIFESLKSSYFAGHYIPFFKEKQTALIAIKRSVSYFSKLSDDLKRDEEILNEIFKREMTIDTDIVLSTLKDEKGPMLILMKYHGNYLSVVSPKLKNDKDIVYEAFKNYPASIGFISEELKANEEFMKSLIHFYGAQFNIRIFPDVCLKNREIILEAVQNNGLSLQFVGESFQNDKEIVLIAIENNGSSYQFASYSMKNDVDVVMKTLNKAPHLMNTFPMKFKEDRKIVIEMLKSNPNFYKYVTWRMKGDKELEWISKKYSTTIRQVESWNLNFHFEN
jgi:hypothetical protein